MATKVELSNIFVQTITEAYLKEHPFPKLDPEVIKNLMQEEDEMPSGVYKRIKKSVEKKVQNEPTARDEYYVTEIDKRDARIGELEKQVLNLGIVLEENKSIIADLTEENARTREERDDWKSAYNSVVNQRNRTEEQLGAVKTDLIAAHERLLEVKAEAYDTIARLVNRLPED